MSSAAGHASRLARGGAHYALCIACDLHFYAAALASTAAFAAYLAHWPAPTPGRVLIRLASLIWLGWAFWSVLRHLAGKRVEAEAHKRVADGVESAADLYLTLTDPEAIYYMRPVKSRLPGAILIVVSALGLAGIGLVVTDLVTSLGPEPWGEKWQNAISRAGFRTWLLFLALTAAELLACQLSSKVRRLVRSLNHGRRFADIEGKSRL